jgi:hypothetical protein
MPGEATQLFHEPFPAAQSNVFAAFNAACNLASRTKKTKMRNFWSIYPVEPAWTPPLISLRLF